VESGSRREERDVAKIGVLALQGGVEPHARALRDLGHAVVLVRTAADLDDIDGLVLPGGESTTQLDLLAREGLETPLDRFVACAKPVLATCAGLILAARKVMAPAQRSFEWIDVVVKRNGYGRQLDSFEAESDDGRIPLVFIRAPRVVEVGRGVMVLATHAREPVLVRQRNVTAATFHPELTEDRRVHKGVFGCSAGTPTLIGP
jgi:5'-phosphate synthase pdxT subunit